MKGFAEASCMPVWSGLGLFEVGAGRLAVSRNGLAVSRNSGGLGRA